MSRTIGRVCIPVLLLAVWMPTFAAADAGEFKESLRFANKTETKKIELSIPSSARVVSVEVKSTLRSGAFKWTLRDATGNVRLRGAGRGEGKYMGSTGNMEAISGVWTLEVEFEDATGSYDIVCMTG